MRARNRHAPTWGEVAGPSWKGSSTGNSNRVFGLFRKSPKGVK